MNLGLTLYENQNFTKEVNTRVTQNLFPSDLPQLCSFTKLKMEEFNLDWS